MFEAIHSFLDNITRSIQPTNLAGMGITYLVALLVEIGLPIPFMIETLAFFASYNIGPLSLQVLSIISMSLAGRESGAAILYWLSRYLGQRFLIWLEKYSPQAGKKMDKLQEKFRGRVVFTITAVRLTPGLMQVPSLIGGTIRLNYQRFALGVALSSLAYDFIVVGLGFAARMGLQGVRSELRVYIIISILVVLFIMWGIFLALQRR